MEIERKYLLKRAPRNISEHPFSMIQQAYLCVEPVIRIRKKDDSYILTYKSAGLMEREEMEVSLTKDSYQHLLKKCDGNVVSKKRHFVPLENGLTAEVDIFQHGFDGLVLAEVEFESREQADAFVPPSWLNQEVTEDARFQNCNLCMMTENERITLLKEILLP